MQKSTVNDINATGRNAVTTVWPKWLRVLAVAGASLLATLVLLVLLLAFMPWDWLREPVNRYVSEATGRKFQITRQLDVKLGWTTRVMANGIEFANPLWATSPYLLRADAAEIDIRLLPLLRGVIELPLLRLSKPELGMQLMDDGRRTWALGQDTSDTSTVPKIGALVVDQGTLHFIGRGADIHTEFAIAPEVGADGQPTANSALPLSYKAKGSWKKEPFTAEGRTGGVLRLSEPAPEPFPLQISASAGRTTFKATGTVADLAGLDGADASFDLRGRSLADLYQFVGVVLPGTPPYALRGRLSKKGNAWAVNQLNGRLGQSDLSGDLGFQSGQALPVLTGKLQSKSLDFKDLGPIIGAPSGASSTPVARAPLRPGKVLPNTPLDFSRLKTMNADVQYNVADIKNVEALPLDRMNVHIVLTNGVLQLAPLDMGVAGGKVVGEVRIDANNTPAQVSAKLDGRALQLNKLFPTIALTQGSLGKFTGKFDLQGQGHSAAQILGSASGNMAMLMGQGQISNILLEFLGLDGGEIFKFLLGGDRNVRLRCAAAAFDVQKGLMTSRTIVLDTTDTVILGGGQISLADETLNLRLEPAPKDRSIFSLRSPIKIGGTFAAPSGGPEAGALALRAGAALALGAINPLLALAATFEPGPGEDTNCVQVLAKAGTPIVRQRR